MNLITAREFYPVMKQLLGLPDHCISFQLSAAFDGVVTVSCEHYLSTDVAGLLEWTRTFSQFELVRRTAAAQPHRAEVIGFDEWMRERAESAHRAFMAGHAAGGIDYASTCTTCIIPRRNGAPFKEVVSGVETRKSINAYKAWLQGTGHRPCDHEYQQDRFGPDGQSVCMYCRDIKSKRSDNG